MRKKTLTCSVGECVHNDQGRCDCLTLYVSEQESGYPQCMSATFIKTGGELQNHSEPATPHTVIESRQRRETTRSTQ